MNKKVKIAIVLVLLIAIVLMICWILFSRVKIKEYSNSNFRVKYDTTWKVKDSKDELYLVHKKTNSELRIQCKVLESNYIDTSLDDIIDDVIYSIEKQNEGYDLINRSSGSNNKFESYSYLYEQEDKQMGETFSYRKG